MSAVKAPFNITILNPDTYISDRAMLPVSSVSIYESSSTRMHPDGLFSEVIFGNLGVGERIVRKGFIRLNTKVFSPHLFKQIITLKKFYIDILSGKAYAYFDKESKDLVLSTPDNPEADTGFSFFLKTYPKLEFKYTDSAQRRDKIDLLKKYNDIVFMDKLVVISAGLRDIRETNGRVQMEDINKLYASVITLTSSIPEDSQNDPVFDTVRYQIQMKIMELYRYLSDLIDGKGGFSQKRYAARNVAYATRNVITAANISGCNHPDDPDMFSIRQMQVPLYQAMKTYTPKVIHSLANIFFKNIFDNQSTSAALINPDTLELNYYDIPPSTMREFTSEIGDFIDNFRNPEIHHLPVRAKVNNMVKKPGAAPYLYLVYDLDTVIVTFRNIHDLKNSYRDEIDMSKVRPMTYAEMAYIATYNATYNTHVDSVRHPVLNMEGNDVYRIYVTSTVPSRVVTMTNLEGNVDEVNIKLPAYPIVGNDIKQSQSVHPAVLAGLDGDHDGDTMGTMGLMSDEANKEIADYLNSKSSIINSKGKLIQGLADGRNVKLQLYATSCGKL